MDRIAQDWPQLQPLDGSPGDVGDRGQVNLDFKLASIIDSLVRSHRERRGRPSSAELLFRFLMRNEPMRADVNARLAADFERLRKWFMALTHLRAGKMPKVDEHELQNQFGKFEGMLHSFVGDFFTGTAELDEILQQANR